MLVFKVVAFPKRQTLQIFIWLERSLQDESNDILLLKFRQVFAEIWPKNPNKNTHLFCLKISVRMRGIKSSVRTRMVTSRDHSRPIRSLKKDEKYKDVVLLILLLVYHPKPLGPIISEL